MKENKTLEEVMRNIEEEIINLIKQKKLEVYFISSEKIAENENLDTYNLEFELNDGCFYGFARFQARCIIDGDGVEEMRTSTIEILEDRFELLEMYYISEDSFKMEIKSEKIVDAIIGQIKF